jgi:hypothetical protein
VPEVFVTSMIFVFFVVADQGDEPAAEEELVVCDGEGRA